MPTAVALQHLSAGRGTALAHVGVIFLLLGGFGHMGYGTWQLMVAQMPGPDDPASLAAYFDRAAAVHDLLLPLMMSLILGLILLAVAARRAGHLPLFVPCALVTVAVFDFVVQTTSLADNKWVPAASWALALLGLGYAGVRVLRMSDGDWAALYPQAQLQSAPKPKTDAAQAVPVETS